MESHNSVLEFWFNELSQKDWFVKNTELDKKISSRFHDLHLSASKGELFEWRKTPEGRVAEIIVLDQFSRNMFRGTAQAFAYDAMALVLAQEIVLFNLDRALPLLYRGFAYMPYMHSESLVIHQEAVKLFALPGLEENLKFEMLHKEIIEKFGRYPYRNEILGRTSTQEEIEFLKTHNGF